MDPLTPAPPLHHPCITAPLCPANQLQVPARFTDASGLHASDPDSLTSPPPPSTSSCPPPPPCLQVPARFTDASGLQAFDLDSLLSMAERNRKWQDPTTMVNSSIEQLQVGVGWGGGRVFPRSAGREGRGQLHACGC